MKMEKEEFNFVLSKGEDYKTEFKENLNGIDKDIVAFSNADGGIILIGVNDKKQIKGITINNKLKAELQSIARNCDPEISVDISEFVNVEEIRELFNKQGKLFFEEVINKEFTIKDFDKNKFYE